jgi:hypothetical protein
MGLSRRLHVVVDPEMADLLARLARRSGRTVGDLVREAVAAHYGADDRRAAARHIVEPWAQAHDPVPLPDPEDGSASYERIRADEPG